MSNEEPTYVKISESRGTRIFQTREHGRLFLSMILVQSQPDMIQITSSRKESVIKAGGWGSRVVVTSVSSDF